MKALLAAAAALSLGLLATPAPAEGLFDTPITLAQPIAKLPAGGLFGSLLAANKTAECACPNCTCANCGCPVTTASEEEVIAAARLADQQRYIYTVAADGSFRAVPRAAALTSSSSSSTQSTTAYAPVVVTSEPVCANGQCYLPSASYGGSNYSQSGQSSYPYSGDAPYQATDSGRSGLFGRRRGGSGGGGFRLFRGGCASGQCGR